MSHTKSPCKYVKYFVHYPILILFKIFATNVISYKWMYLFVRREPFDFVLHHIFLCDVLPRVQLTEYLLRDM